MGEVSYSPNGIIAVFLAFGCILLLFLLLVSGEIAAMHNQEMAALVFSDEELPEELEEHDRAQIIMMRRAMFSIESKQFAPLFHGHTVIAGTESFRKI